MQEFRAQLYSFAFRSERKKFLAIPIRYWIQLGLMVLTVLWLWLQFWFQAALVSVIILLLNYIYAAAKRHNYKVFAEMPPIDAFQTDNLLPDEKLAVYGTGLFMSGEKETRLILAPGELWHTPKGELCVMLEAAPELYKYQFVEPHRIEKIKLGQLSLAGVTAPAVELTFMSSWVQTNLTDEFKANQQEPEETAVYKKRTITLSFDEMTAAKRVFVFLSAAH